MSAPPFSPGDLGHLLVGQTFLSASAGQRSCLHFILCAPPRKPAAPARAAV